MLIARVKASLPLATVMLASIVATTTAGVANGQQQATSPTVASGPEVPELSAGPDGTFTIKAADYRAAFARAGATLEVANPISDELPEVALSLMLRDWGRDGSSRKSRSSESVMPQRAGSAKVHFQHDGVTERYRATATGYEQSFVLHERPAGNGDYVLGIAVTSDYLHADARQPAQQAIEFQCGEAPAIRYGEAVAFSRANRHDQGRVPVATRYDGAGRIELIVPGTFLDQASYPVIVDPAVGPVLAPPGSGGRYYNPDICYDPALKQWLMVWEDRSDPNPNRRDIKYTWFFRGSLNHWGGTLTSSGFNQTPTVAYIEEGLSGFSGFLVVWSGSGGLKARRIGKSFTPTLPAPMPLTTVPLGVRDLRPAISVRGSVVLVAWDRTPSGSANPTQILVRRALLNTLNLQPNLSPEFVVESTPTGYVQRVRMPRTHTLNGSSESQRLVWERWFTNPAPGDFDVRTAGALVTGSSISYADGPGSLPGAASIGVNERRPDVAMREGVFTPEILAVWEDTGNIRGLRFGVTSPGPAWTGAFDITSSSAIDTEPAVGGGLTEWSVGYMRATQSSNPGSQDLYGARVYGLGNVEHVSADRPIHLLGDTYQTSLRASTVVASPNATDQPEGVKFAWQLQSNTIGLLEDIRVRQYDPVAATISPFGQGCSGPGGYTPEIRSSPWAYPGNPDFRIYIDNIPTPGATLCALLIGDQLATLPVPGAPGCQLYMNLPLIQAIPMVSGWPNSVTIPIPPHTPPGVVLAFQWAVYTPGHNTLGWITSDDLDISWQQ